MKTTITKEEIKKWKEMADRFKQMYGIDVTWIDMRYAYLNNHTFLICNWKRYPLQDIFMTR